MNDTITPVAVMAEQNTTYTVAGVIRDGKGRFQPGSKSLGGRAPKAFEKGIKDALSQRWSPEVIVDRIEAAFELAKSQGSARGMLAATELVCHYLYGKPVMQIATVNEGKTALLEQLLHGTDFNAPLLPEREGE